MFLKKTVFVSLLFFALLQPRTGLTLDLAEIESWSALEQETLHLLKRFAPEEALSPSAPLGKKVRFYLRAGLWSSAEQILLSQPQAQGKRLLLLLYLHEQQFDRVYRLYQKEPELYRDEPILRLGAGQGALLQKAYGEALTLLGAAPPSDQHAPYYFYLSAQAYAGLRDRAGFDRMIEAAVRWGERHPDSPWTARARLLKGYDQLSRKRYQEAFFHLGQVLSENAYSDLALLGIASGYLEMGEPETFLSLLEGFQETQEESAHADRFFEILGRYQESKGDFQGAIETARLGRIALQKERETLAEQKERLLDGGRLALTAPPGALLKKALLDLEGRTGEKKEAEGLIRQIEFHHRQLVLVSLIASERALKKKEEEFRGAMVRRCLAVESRSAVSPAQARSPLYLQARSAALEGKKEEMEALLKKLLGSHSSGRDREEATFRLAELAFERRDYATAATYYESFSDRPASYLSRTALYKGAWSDYLQGKGMKAIQSLLRQRLLMKGAASTGSSCESALESETRSEYFRLLTLALEAEGGADRFITAAKELSPEEGFPLALELAQYYEAADRKEELIQLAAGWAAAYPLYAETPVLHHAWVEALRGGPSAFTPQALSARVAFIERYWPDGVWAQENGEARWSRVKPLLKEQLRDLLSYFHIEAKKTESVAYYREILPWYERYLNLFPAESETGEARFLYAEVLNGMGEKKKAAEVYHTSAYQDPPHRLAAEAGYRAVLLSEKLYSPSDPDLWDGYARFIQTFPSDRRVAQIYLKEAELAFQQGAYDQSRQWAEAAAKNENGVRCTGDSKGCALESTAQKLIVQGYLAQKAYPEAIRYLRGLLAAKGEPPARGPAPARPAPFDPKEKAEFRKLLVLAYYQQGEGLKEKSRLPAAADSYWQAYQEGMAGEMGPLALFEAASLWGTLNRAKAEEALGLFQERYPNSPLYHPVLIRLAALYLETDRPREAAQIYEKAGQVRSDPGFALQSLGEAIALYEAMGNWGKVSLLSLQMAEQAGNDKEKWTEGMVKQAEAKLKLGEEKGAKKILTDLVKNQKPEWGAKENRQGERDRISLHLAKAHLLLADLEIKQFEQIKLVTPLEKNLQKKKALFDRLLNDYALAAEAPSPPLALAATYRMGEMFEEFSRSLLESERPKDLSREEKQAYEAFLKEQALPYLKKAVEAYRQNIDWGRKALIENEWITRSQDRFRRIQEDPTASGEIFEPKG